MSEILKILVVSRPETTLHKGIHFKKSLVNLPEANYAQLHTILRNPFKSKALKTEPQNIVMIVSNECKVNMPSTIIIITRLNTFFFILSNKKKMVYVQNS